MEVLLYLIVSISKLIALLCNLRICHLERLLAFWSSFLKSLFLFKSYKCCYSHLGSKKRWQKCSLRVMLTITVNCQRHFFEKTLLWAYQHLESTLSWNIKMKIKRCRRSKKISALVSILMRWKIMQSVEWNLIGWSVDHEITLKILEFNPNSIEKVKHGSLCFRDTSNFFMKLRQIFCCCNFMKIFIRVA